MTALHPVVAHTRANVRQYEQVMARAITNIHTRMLHTLQPTLDAVYHAIKAQQQSGGATPFHLQIGSPDMLRVRTIVSQQVDAFADETRSIVASAIWHGTQIGHASTHIQLIAAKAQPAAPTLVQHVTQVSSDLYGTFGTEASQGVMSALMMGISLGSPVSYIMHSVTKALTVSLHRALVIAGESLIGAVRGASHATMAANSDVAAGWLWIADIGETPTPCIACILMHGTKHPLSETMQSHVRCRCQMVTYFADNPDIAGQSGKDWFLAQDAATQEEILGSARYALWRQHRISLDEMIGTDSDGIIYVRPLKELGVK